MSSLQKMPQSETPVSSHQNDPRVPAQEERGDSHPADREPQCGQISESNSSDDHEVPAPDIRGRLHLRQNAEAGDWDPQSRSVDPKESALVC